MVTVGRCVARGVTTVMPPESWPLGPLAWPHQLSSALAPSGALIPTVGAKSLCLTVNDVSPLSPPDWMLEQSIATAAPAVLTAWPVSLVKTFRLSTAGAFWRLIATPVT